MLPDVDHFVIDGSGLDVLSADMVLLHSIRGRVGRILVWLWPIKPSSCPRQIFWN